jgi:hypothetical protein
METAPSDTDERLVVFGCPRVLPDRGPRVQLLALVARICSPLLGRSVTLCVLTDNDMALRFDLSV